MWTRLWQGLAPPRAPFPERALEARLRLAGAEHVLGHEGYPLQGGFSRLGCPVRRRSHRRLSTILWGILSKGNPRTLLTPSLPGPIFHQRGPSDSAGEPSPWEKAVPWVSTGRSPHGGEAMTARDLHGILTASRRAGARRFLFQPDPDLGASEWSVISGLCGTRWRQSPEGYWPADSTRPDVFGAESP